jgi:hypothetical protein
MRHHSPPGRYKKKEMKTGEKGRLSWTRMRVD